MISLEKRVELLERRASRYQTATILLGVLISGVLAAAATTSVNRSTEEAFSTRASSGPSTEVHTSSGVPAQVAAEAQPTALTKQATLIHDVLRTRRLEVVNGDGDVVVMLTPSVNDDGLVFTYDKDGKNLAYLGSSAGNGNGLLLVNSKAEKNLVSVGSDPESGDGAVNIRNRNQEVLISIWAEGSNGDLWLNNDTGRNLLWAGGSDDGDGMLVLKNTNGNRLVQLEASGNDGDALVMNADQKTLAYVGADVSGHGHFVVNSKSGTQLFYAGANKFDNGLLRLSNKSGNLELVGIATDDSGYLDLMNSRGYSLVTLDADLAGNGDIWVYSKDGLPTWTSQAPPPAPTASRLGDLDSDGDVDASDFLIFSENYGEK